MSLMSPALAGRFFTTSATWEAQGDLWGTSGGGEEESEPVLRVGVGEVCRIRSNLQQWKMYLTTIKLY